MKKTVAISSVEMTVRLEQLFHRGQYWDVLKVAEEWLRGNESYEVRLVQLEALRQWSLAKEALPLAESLSTVRAKNPIVESIRGWANYRLGNKPRGKKILEEALLDWPCNDRLLYEMSQIISSEGNPQIAQELIRRAVKQQPNYANLLLNLASIYLRSRQPSLAAEALKVARECNGPQLVNTYLLGKIEITNGQPDLGLQLAEDLVAAYPRAFQGHLLTAKALIALGRYRESLPRIKTAMQFGPRNQEVFDTFYEVLDRVKLSTLLVFTCQLVVNLLIRRATHYSLRHITRYRPEGESPR